MRIYLILLHAEKLCGQDDLNAHNRNRETSLAWKIFYGSAFSSACMWCILQQIEVLQMRRRQPVKVSAVLFGSKLISPVTQFKNVHSILNNGRAFAQQHKILYFLSGFVHLIKNNLALDNHCPAVPD